MEHTPLPVLVAIALPIDRSPLEPLLLMGREANWKVHLLHAAPPPVTSRDEVGDSQSLEGEEYERGLYQLSDELVSVATWFEDSGIHVVFRLEEGPIVETILSMAEEVDAQMIVIVGQRHMVSHRPVLGSVASTLLQRAERPLLVLPTVREAELEESPLNTSGMDAAVDRLLEVIERSDPDLDGGRAEELQEVRDAAMGVRSERIAPPDSSNRLLRALHRFETEHPSLTRAINDVAYYLSGTGI